MQQCACENPRLFDHLVGASQQGRRHCEAKRSRCLKIDCKLEFDVKVIPHKGDTDWIEPLIFKMNDCLRGETIPAANPTCEYCGYREAAGKELQARVKKPVTKSNKSATLGI